MKWLKFLAALTFLWGSVSASEIEARAIYSIWHPSLKHQEGGPDAHTQKVIDEFENFSIFLYIKNVGKKAIRIPTESSIIASWTLEGVPDTCVYLLHWMFRENPLGIKGVVSEATLGIVTLKPEETTVIHIRTHIDERYQKLRINYEVEEDFAKQNNLWYGNISVLSERDNLEMR